jgi:hypothetical protein
VHDGSYKVAATHKTPENRPKGDAVYEVSGAIDGIKDPAVLGVGIERARLFLGYDPVVWKSSLNTLDELVIRELVRD